MQKDVLISITGTVISDSGAPDVIELVTAGRYYKRDGHYYIRYEEGESGGFAGSVTTVKVDGERAVTLTRQGGTSSRLLLEQGRRHLCRYDSGEGLMMVGISGCRIHSALDETGGELQFQYMLDINAQLVSRNEVHISIKEANAKHAGLDEIGN